ncbi:ABC-type nitrate/sulfonate/bicarbonate transport system ATPase subunit [Melghirimyces profundicolus]|uniref:ABC-type nitrate/sulfonate/bicarbonate transport system ATPase subunit n=1 Tax=Melghirimyces profundicolus TaxID=1242148 RepID=A0A2T6C7M8_9BACL|nr:ABC transporter ATP-binding protein [Melghirimyces profundicolus]PTX64331.1 ABC-type nitrate/sulfonate/bicarbonate transport system ATPase subunit [Melghirimyces profundicolus]
MKLEMEALEQSYASPTGERRVIDRVDLKVEEGEFVSLIGPSGCGKSTLFNLVSGLERPLGGRIRKDGSDITGATGHVSYMPQKDCLFPWRTVVENASLAAEVAGKDKKKARERAERLLPVFGLEDFAGEYPARLSGGMRQRAALLRTVMADRDLWLLDEPMGALDALTRERIQDWLLQILSRFPRTVLFITHSVDEAVYLSDRVVVLTPRPARVKGELSITLPRPRTREQMTSEAFLQAKQWLWEKLHEDK